MDKVVTEAILVGVCLMQRKVQVTIIVKSCYHADTRSYRINQLMRVLMLGLPQGSCEIRLCNPSLITVQNPFILIKQVQHFHAKHLSHHQISIGVGLLWYFPCFSEFELQIIFHCLPHHS